MASFNDYTVPDSDPTSPGAGQGLPPSDVRQLAPINVSAPANVSGGGYTPPTTASTQSGGDVPSWLTALLGAAPGLAGLFNANTQAGDQARQAQQFTDQANQYGTILNPYGAYRDAAAKKLAALQADPSSIKDTPGFQFALQQGTGAVGNRDVKRFGVGSGSTDADLMQFGQGLASKTYNDTIKQYSDQAGVGIGPSAAGDIYKTGMLGNLASQAAANAAKGNLVQGATNTLSKALTDFLGSGTGKSLMSMLTSSGMSQAQALKLLQDRGLAPVTTQDSPFDPGPGDNPENPFDYSGAPITDEFSPDFVGPSPEIDFGQYF